MAEAVRGIISYELNLDFKPAEFFKAKFENQINQNKKLCEVIFKLKNNVV